MKEAEETEWLENVSINIRIYKLVWNKKMDFNCWDENYQTSNLGKSFFKVLKSEATFLIKIFWKFYLLYRLESFCTSSTRISAKFQIFKIDCRLATSRGSARGVEAGGASTKIRIPSSQSRNPDRVKCESLETVPKIFPDLSRRRRKTLK